MFGLDGAVLGAISVCGPAARIDEAARERIIEPLRKAADAISRGLGWRGGLPTDSARLNG